MPPLRILWTRAARRPRWLLFLAANGLVMVYLFWALYRLTIGWESEGVPSWRYLYPEWHLTEAYFWCERIWHQIRYGRSMRGWCGNTPLVAYLVLTLGLASIIFLAAATHLIITLCRNPSPHHCPLCDYDLRGTLAGGGESCPECGAPVPPQECRPEIHAPEPLPDEDWVPDLVSSMSASTESLNHG